MARNESKTRGEIEVSEKKKGKIGVCCLQGGFLVSWASLSRNIPAVRKCTIDCNYQVWKYIINCTNLYKDNVVQNICLGRTPYEMARLYSQEKQSVFNKKITSCLSHGYHRIGSSLKYATPNNIYCSSKDKQL
jgi:hypothetical protein